MHVQISTIEFLFQQGKSLTVSELMQQTGYGRKTVSKHLRTLLHIGLIHCLGTRICSVTGNEALAYLMGKDANE